MTRIVRGPGGYVLPLEEQPWCTGHGTPNELIKAWERASREDWTRFDAFLRREREAQAKFDRNVRAISAVVLAAVLVVWIGCSALR